MALPNVRNIFTPDPGFTLFEADLKGADAQVVAWEAGDERLKEGFRLGADMHIRNAQDLFPAVKGLFDASPKEIKATPFLNAFRQKAKVGVHATNYGCKEATLAISLQISVREAIAFQNAWFEAHPGIEEWHQRTAALLRTTRTVKNKFGFRRQYFDRADEILPEALAWVPQSTVGIAINMGWVQLRQRMPYIQVLLQVHDSIVGQFPTSYLEAEPELPNRILDAMKVVVPYDDPLTIPLSIKLSDKSWGACKE